MFKPFSSINSRRTTQDVLNILKHGCVKESTVSGTSFSRQLHHSNDNVSSDSQGSFHNSGERNSSHSANPKKPGLRLGLKRAVVKTVDDGPPNKRDKDAIPLPKGTRCFSVLFAKPQTKKNKTWEDDGYLILKDTCLSLKNHQGELISCGRLKNQVLQEGHHFPLGDKIVQVQEELADLPSAFL